MIPDSAAMETKGTATFLDLLTAWCSARSITATREEMLAAILCGDVEIADERCRNAQKKFPRACIISVRESSPLLSTSEAALSVAIDLPGLPYVSRGGQKLEAALDAWSIQVSGRVWLDAGCSTGGFSHCLLLRGATTVHAVDVGYNVLDWRLRNLTSIVVHERTNIMSLSVLDPVPAAAVADLSFRSMEGAARKILGLVSSNELYALIKPQFERKYRKGDVADGAPFKGIVAGEESMLILADLALRLAAEGVRVERIMKAGLKGRSGNQEFIAQLSLLSATEEISRARLREWNSRVVSSLQSGSV